MDYASPVVERFREEIFFPSEIYDGVVPERKFVQIGRVIQSALKADEIADEVRARHWRKELRLILGVVIGEGLSVLDIVPHDDLGSPGALVRVSLPGYDPVNVFFETYRNRRAEYI